MVCEFRMGVVYRARDEHLKHDVAIPDLLPLVENVYLLYTSSRFKFSQVVSPSCRNFRRINLIGH